MKPHLLAIRNVTYFAFVLALTFSSSSHATTLKETIEDAIIHNPEFRAEVKQYRSIQAEVRGAQAGFFPTIDISAGIGYEEVNNQSINNTGDGLTRQEASIRLTQNIFAGFGTVNEVGRQEFRLDAQGFQAESKANDIALSMTKAYIDLMKEQSLLQLSQESLYTHIKILDQITKRNDAGIGNQIEVDQAQARLALAESNFASSKNNLLDAAAKFRRILGRDPSSDLVKPVFDFKLPESIDTATSIAITDHPTLKASNGDIAEARMQHQASSQNFYPRIDLEIEKTFDNNLSGVIGHNESLQAMLRLNWNLYRGGRDISERNRTASALHEATEIRNNTRRQIIENIHFAWNAKTFTTKQIPFINIHIKMTHDTLTGYRQQFNLGRRSLLDLLNTENEYTSALRTLINSEHELLKSKYRILAGTGHLLNELNIDYSFIDAEDHPYE